MTLPKKRAPSRSNILRAPERVYQRHRKWLRSFLCVCSDLPDLINCCEGAIEVSHIRTAANAGTGLKPRDDSAVPMCAQHHREYHQHGHASFEKFYRIDLAKFAAEFASKSPDKKLREALRDPRPLSGPGIE